MADCELTETCIFFNDKMADMPVMADIYKDRYCRGAKSECARYLVFSTIGRENVPIDLYPNQRERAEAIVAEE